MLNRLSLLLMLCLAGSIAWATAPTITSIAPTSAAVGTVIAITGTDLFAVTAVTFNGIAAKTITDNTATSLKVTVPEGATSGKLAVTTAGGTVTSLDNFIVYLGLKTNAKDKAEMVWVPGGTFTMGSAAGMGLENEHMAHQVTLTGYWIYKYDVTVAQYRSFCRATGRELPKYTSDKSWKDKTSWDDPALQQHPIVYTNWYDAKAYADWAGMALPTEAQWEYAARGPQRNNYPWGGTAIKDELNNGWDDTKCANYYNSCIVGKSTWPVGSFPAGASWCGAQDMAGNVWQWCGDWYGDYTAVTDTNPTGPATGTSCVLRGGSWGDGNQYLRSAGRNIRYPGSYDHGIGFRCVSLSTTITNVTPSSAAVGTVIAITGTDLSAVTAVTFNGIAAKTITDNTATSLKVTVPEGATSGKLTVTTAGGTATNSNDFIVLFGQKTNAKDSAEMIWVPGGSFIMGSTFDVGGEAFPAHQVTISGYWIYKNDVTVAQYLAFCAATTQIVPSWPKGDMKSSWKGKTNWDDPTLQQHPIVNVSWNDAKAYADWAGATLPTEAQWEYTARGPQGRNYPWGGTATIFDDYNGWDATKCANSRNSFDVGKSTWPVGSFPTGTSWCGAQDMAGNVEQWCGDWFGNYTATAVTNPTGPTTGTRRVRRGGSWDSPYANVTNCSAYRYGFDPALRDSGVGFRCVLRSPGL